MPNSPRLSAVQSALRESIRSGAHRTGPFLVHFDAHSDNPHMNYAVPDDGAAPTPAEVADLVSTFRERSRAPRLEYLRPAPGLDAALASAGFAVDRSVPLLVLAELVAPPVPAGLVVAPATSDEDLLAASAVQNAAFGVGGGADGGDVARQRALVEDGGAVVLARLAGEPVGAGAFTAPRGGLSQVAGIAVLPAFRRRGIASAVCADLTARVLAAGCAPFLETEPDDKVTRLYGPLGYRVVGESASATLT
ncbi:GNAT family N-acetyltransferase [Saccharothrix sp. Mg75]|uniref:GNAT family N-acetyltransferase n=1 Tax=Saccharothrix sp. Mg75 TaxID=3445357 RepID=UPI003EE8E027